MVEMNVDTDFADVIDGLESVTVLRRGGGQVTVDAARRREAETREAEPSGGRATAADIVWDLPWPDGEPWIRIGDRVRDALGGCGTVLTIERRRPGTRLRCRTRDLGVANGLDARVDVQLAEWVDDGSGPEITAWRTVAPSVPARVQPAAVEADHATTPPTSVSTYRIVLDTDKALGHDHRVVDAQGAVYRVDRFVQSERIDVLPVVEATLVTPAP